ncbi:homoserine kinase [Phaeodactylibacter sp.]|uniref:homoserine kinase n=1 Tax=Phaeodactylibacter sp. TaxID=1940289 RepID=UPI0025D53537|nr:homoserine kinase [Phaeodactylibacter sp.]MCI4649848.1 homoserine kinase [Phaeodactylibacter sp.]MCI5092264.1 homoserine kinase [Phaeodactylibacter sp.]
MNKEVRVFAPATVANVAVGFDILGFAIDGPGDEIIARYSNASGVTISCITGDGGKLPLKAEKNTAGFAAIRLLEQLGKPELGVELEIHKKMPFGSGLGSSAASAAAGVMAVNALLDMPVPKIASLHCAVLGEQIADGAYHADNVAPSLLGGIILIRANEGLDVHSLPIPDELYAAVVYPHVSILTKDARDVLRPTTTLPQCIQQTGNLGGLVVGLYESDYELIGRSLQDVIIEPQRAQLIPGFATVKSAALKAGALGCSISGAGPSVFALCKGRETAQSVGAAMQKAFLNQDIPCDLFVSPINKEGAKILA